MKGVTHDEQSKTENEKLLGNTPVSKALLAMGIPTMIGMLINALYNLVDAYFVGGLGESQMGAISIVYPLWTSCCRFRILVGSRAASYFSRLLGQWKEEQTNKCKHYSLLQFDHRYHSHSFLRCIPEANFTSSRCNQKHSPLCNDLCRNLYYFLHFQCI